MTKQNLLKKVINKVSDGTKNNVGSPTHNYLTLINAVKEYGNNIDKCNFEEDRLGEDCGYAWQIEEEYEHDLSNPSGSFDDGDMDYVKQVLGYTYSNFDDNDLIEQGDALTPEYKPLTNKTIYHVINGY